MNDYVIEDIRKFIEKWELKDAGIDFIRKASITIFLMMCCFIIAYTLRLEAAVISWL
jgi:hypothetical protein